MNPVYLRLLEIARELGQNETTVPNRYFEELLDLSSGRIAQIAKTDSIDKLGGKAVGRLAAIGYNPQWVNDGELPKKLFNKNQDTNVEVYHLEDKLPDHVILIPEYNVKFSAGGGSIIYEVEEASRKLYEYSWFVKEHLNPKNVKRFKVSGNSMEPTLYDGDSVLVNQEESGFESIIDGKVYAIRYENELRVKRLFKNLDGSLILHSDNTEFYKREELSPEMVQEHITVIGRVRDKSGAGGL